MFEGKLQNKILCFIHGKFLLMRYKYVGFFSDKLLYNLQCESRAELEPYVWTDLINFGSSAGIWLLITHFLVDPNI